VAFRVRFGGGSRAVSDAFRFRVRAFAAKARARFSSGVRSVVAIFDKLKFSAYKHIDLDLDLDREGGSAGDGDSGSSLSLPLPVSPPTLAHRKIDDGQLIRSDPIRRPTLFSPPIC